VEFVERITSEVMGKEGSAYERFISLRFENGIKKF
jgi:hypothetical protein